VWHAMPYIIIMSMTGGEDASTAVQLARTPILIAAAFAVSMPGFRMAKDIAEANADVLAQIPGIDAIMVRYNAAHPGAETEVFPKLGAASPAVIAYTATRWGDLINPALTPQGEPTPRASDCYRFALSHPRVHACMAGPANRAELEEALLALERGPLTPDEDAWMRRVGAAVKRHARAHSGSVSIVDRLMGAHSP